MQLSSGANHSAGYPQASRDQPHILPIFLPFATSISPGFVPCIPVSHEQPGDIVTLLPSDATQSEPGKDIADSIPDLPLTLRLPRNLRHLT